MVNQSNTR
jgi:hypothetical protein